MAGTGSVNSETSFKNTGAVEQDSPEQKTNVAPFDAQLDHRYQNPLNKQSDSGMSAKGQNPEHSGEREGKDELDQDTDADGEERDADPGQRQKQNQGERQDDDLAA